ncbi:MAG TPA: hypothetical protein VIV34_04645 [Pseudolabrys sp.]
MRVPLSKPAFTAAFVLLLAAGQVCTAETLRVAGTGGAMGMMRQVASAFAESSGIELEFVPGLGSKGAIRATADGLSILPSQPGCWRPMKPLVG